jgi:hypothetical protein
VIAVAGCSSSDPRYFPSVPPSITTGEVAEGEAPPALVMTVPMRLPTADDEARRMQVATETGIPIENIPSVRRDQTDLEISWRLENAGDRDATAILAVAAANELFRFDPVAFVVDPEEDEPPPPLMGGRPIQVPAGEAVEGVFREDELIEAAQDLDGMTRGGVNPVRALITRWDTRDITGGEGGVLPEIPSAAIPLLLEVSLTVQSTQPLTATAFLRVRDRSERVVEDPVNPGALVPPSTTVYVPPAPAP